MTGHQDRSLCFGQTLGILEGITRNYPETKLALEVVIEHKSLESVSSVVGETVDHWLQAASPPGRQRRSLEAHDPYAGE